MRSRGVILLETVIAAGVVAATMIAIAHLLALTALQQRAVAQRRVAIQEAANSLERLRRIPDARLTEESLQSQALSPSAQRQLPGGELTWTLDEAPAAAADPAFKQVIADVSWVNRAGERERIRLTTWRFAGEESP
jgi:Tfp pilus assembly protein PilV